MSQMWSEEHKVITKLKAVSKIIITKIDLLPPLNIPLLKEDAAERSAMLSQATVG